MADIKTCLIDVFQELRDASMNIDSDPVSTMREYGILLGGDKHNLISTDEVYRILEKRFGIQIGYDDFQKLVPAICDSLSMKYERCFNVNDPDDLKFCAYQVHLRA